jgi:hypothetical protein
MKINYVFIIAALLTLGCKEGTTQNNPSTEGSITEQTNKKTESAQDGLKQHGDYSSLFNSPDCKVITVEELSAALGVAFTEMDPKTFCSFKAQFPNNKTWHLSIVRNAMSKNDIQREIQSFTSDETGQLAMQTSETGDTYLCNQHSHGYLSMYNPNYDGSVAIRYGRVGGSRAFTKEERQEHQAMALKLANVLLKKHQK